MTVRAAGRVLVGPPGLPVVGHVPEFLRDRLGFLVHCAQRYGDVVSLRIGRPTLLLNHPEDVKHVLVANAAGYEKTPRMTSPRGKRLSGRGLLTSGGEAHLVRRRLLQPAFHRKVIEPLAAATVANAERMLARWREGAEIDVASEMMDLAQRNLLTALLGERDAERADLREAIAVRRRYMEHVFFVPLGGVVPSRIGRAFRAAMRTIMTTVDRAIAERRAAAAHDAAAPRVDLLAALVALRGENGASLDDDALRDEVITLLVTGYETVGEALGWTLYLLSRNPDAEARLGAEVDAVLGRRAPRVEDVAELRWTSLVLAESMRLYPPTWIFLRIALRADRLPSGVDVPAGTKLYLCPWVMHRDPRFHPDPERFDPERFSETRRRDRPSFSYFPFGGGPRVCIGETFARAESVLALAAVAQRCRLSLAPGQRIVPEPRMTLRPRDGIRMRVELRTADGAPA